MSAFGWCLGQLSTTTMLIEWNTFLRTYSDGILFCICTYRITIHNHHFGFERPKKKIVATHSFSLSMATIIVKVQCSGIKDLLINCCLPIRRTYRMLTDIFASGCVYLEVFNVWTYVFGLLNGRFWCVAKCTIPNDSGGNINNTSIQNYQLSNHTHDLVEKTSLASKSRFFLLVRQNKNHKSYKKTQNQECARHNTFKFRNDWKCFTSWAILFFRVTYFLYQNYKNFFFLRFNFYSQFFP